MNEAMTLIQETFASLTEDMTSGERALFAADLAEYFQGVADEEYGDEELRERLDREDAAEWDEE